MLSPVGGAALGPSAGCRPSLPASLWPLGEEAASPRGGGSDARTGDGEWGGGAGAAPVEVQSIASRARRRVSEARSRLWEDQRRALAGQRRVWEARSERDGRPYSASPR